MRSSPFKLQLSRASASASAEESIDTTSLATGEECALGGGDLLRLAQPPADGDASATMTVVTSQSLDCKAGTQVAIALPDLQTMLNQFSLRLENNMQRVHDQIALATP